VGRWKKRRAVRKLCVQVEAEIEQSVNPLIDAVVAIEGAGCERMQRVGVPAARMMRNLWIGWSRAGKPHASRQAMRRAQRLARGTPMEIQLLAEARPKAAIGRKGWQWRIALPFAASALVGLAHMFSGPASESDRSISNYNNYGPPPIHYTAPKLFEPQPTNTDVQPPALNESLLEKQLDENLPKPPQADQSPFSETPLTFDRFANQNGNQQKQ
jgi:hypothetical protein